MELVAFIMRRIWIRRNALDFDNKFETPKLVFQAASGVLEDFFRSKPST